jgi:poly-beta-1,6-N-acetyl-D-glucosamine synthase
VGDRSSTSVGPFGSRRRRAVRAAFGPAFVRQKRHLTLDGRTGPGYVGRAEDAGPGRILVIVPAHDEEPCIGETLESLAAQTRIADEVVVVADRCLDRTSEIATAHGAAVIETINNVDQKAGALNQALDQILPRLSDNDAVLMMDADTSLSPGFIAAAATRLREPEEHKPRVGGVGAIFFGNLPLQGLIDHLQNNEYIRYAREIGRRKGRADVLTGTATLFSVRALRDVKRARTNGDIPTGPGIYDVAALTEDNELTLALKHLGYQSTSPKACTVSTELPSTASRLFYQRLRWQRGALENLRAFGLTRHTFPYVWRQLLTYLGVMFGPFFWTVFTYTWLSTGWVSLPTFWLAIGGFFILERTWAVKRGGWRSVALSALILPELAYDLFLSAVYVKAAVDTARGVRESWEHHKPAVSGRHGSQYPAVGFASAGVVGIAQATVIGLAFACIAAGLAWSVIAVLVLAGTAQAVLRFSGLDPVGFVRESGESDNPNTSVIFPPKPQGFGGLDVSAGLPPIDSRSAPLPPRSRVWSWRASRDRV